MSTKSRSAQKAIFIETMILPPVHVMAFIIRAGALVLEAHEHYQKRSYRNRYHIAGPQGLLRLSIPLSGGRNSGTPIKELRISEAYDWRQRHIRALTSAYGRAPFFEYYMPGLQQLMEKKIISLFDFNRALLELIFAFLDVEVRIAESPAFGRAVRSVDMRGQFRPGVQAAAAAFPPYYQVFSDRNGFIPGLSIVDLLFNLGPESLLYLEQLRLSDFNLRKTNPSQLLP